MASLLTGMKDKYDEEDNSETRIGKGGMGREETVSGHQQQQGSVSTLALVGWGLSCVPDTE